VIKIVCLVKRKPGMSIEQFVDYYENHHRHLALKHMPTVCRYTRRYIVASGSPVWGEPAGESEYDSVTEAWFENQQTLDETLAHIGQPEVAEVIIADEERFLDRSKSKKYIVVNERDDQPLVI